jgi:hypothetical protein
MKDNRKSTQKERDYALRRIIYVVLVAAKSLDMIKHDGKGDYSKKEVAKIAGLMMARNLDDFFFKRPNPKKQHPDDIFLADFTLVWKPSSAGLSAATNRRISKIAGHIVAWKLPVFTDDEAIKVIRPILEVAVDFVRSCVAHGDAKYTGHAKFYVRRLNGILKKLKIPSLP